jgi:hypothetical protein
MKTRKRIFAFLLIAIVVITLLLMTFGPASSCPGDSGYPAPYPICDAVSITATEENIHMYPYGAGGKLYLPIVGR